MEKTDGYILVGLPFFNSEDDSMKKNFEKSFEIIL